MNVLIALLNVITIGGIIIVVESTAMTGGKKQLIGAVLIIIGLIAGFLTTGSIALN